MPKEKEFLKLIPQIYKQSVGDILLLGFVRGVQKALPSISDKKACELYLKEFNFTQEEYEIDSCYETYKRMKKMYFSASNVS